MKRRPPRRNEPCRDGEMGTRIRFQTSHLPASPRCGELFPTHRTVLLQSIALQERANSKKICKHLAPYPLMLFYFGLVGKLTFGAGAQRQLNFIWTKCCADVSAMFYGVSSP